MRSFMRSTILNLIFRKNEGGDFSDLSEVGERSDWREQRERNEEAKEEEFAIWVNWTGCVE